jgi:hypothetical protein
VKGSRRLARLGLFAGLFFGAPFGCKSAPPPPPPSGQLLLELQPGQASVLVDDRPLLRRPDSSLLKVSLPAGPHRLEVYAPGYFHAYRDITITASTESRLQVALRPDPDVLP